MAKVTKVVGGLASEILGKGAGKGISASGRHVSKEAIQTILGKSKNASKFFNANPIPVQDFHAIKHLSDIGDTRLAEYKAAYDDGVTPIMMGITDQVTNELKEKTLAAQALNRSQPQVEKHVPSLIEVGGVKHDYSSFPGDFGNFMKEAEELYQRPEMKAAFEQKQGRIQEKTERVRQVEAKTEADYPEGKFHRKVGDVGDSIRTLRDAQAGADPAMTRDILGVQAEQGYGVAKGKTAKTAHREGALGFKPDNKGRLMNLEQHHAAFPNAEGSALMDQQAIINNPIFELAIHRKIAQEYDAALGAAAKNMANLPYDVHQEMLHRWLEQFNLEKYWRTKLAQSDGNMSPQEIVASIDEYFQEIVYPTMAMLDGWMAKSDPSKFNTADVRIPKKLTEQARKFLKEKLAEKAQDFTRGGTRTAEQADVAIEEFRRQTNDGAGMFKLRVPTEGMDL